MRRRAGCMKDSGHALMLADKDGSFVVMPQGLFGDKALAAVKNFRISEVKPPKAKKKAVALLGDLKLDRIRSEVKNNKVHALTVFFSAKSHKVNCPFRAIGTERGTWQATVSRYLQRQLTGLAPEDPYKIASSDRLVKLLQGSILGANSGFSIDIEELFYSIPHEDFFKAVHNCTERSGAVAFQNSSGVSVGGFLELLETYLTSTIPCSPHSHFRSQQ
ncbi:hypothetical protein HPB52_002786 [Rhipicephalus sanguineus]|uniref:Tick transposon n=1 Tax=Rhipicephalus sanguineus TaxID=34632 RepID=A0A9D4Q9C7_RHISA|nr:hypothetical protein HPB52_002786 [Rhipicephalus sanguineus]